jgi:hypothetical protein
MLSRLTSYAEGITTDHQCGLDQLLITYSAFVKTSPIMAIKKGTALAVHKLK